ncbi:hypothetical protein lerEdw1_018520 [Lerista edwardsae]|nr:hypothetical protein lerEdw1_018520 [Lerista edwardsae]
MSVVKTLLREASISLPVQQLMLCLSLLLQPNIRDRWGQRQLLQVLHHGDGWRAGPLGHQEPGVCDEGPPDQVKKLPQERPVLPRTGSRRSSLAP